MILPFAASLASAFAFSQATEDAPSCLGEASLLQKRHQTKRVLDNGAAYDSLPENLLGQMIRSNPWKCDLLPEFDIWRRPTCGLSFAESGLHPAYLSALGNSSYDHKNSMRMLFPIGSLPCCSTTPFCSAPACADSGKLSLLDVDSKKCTKRDAHENFEFMSKPEVWPAYHGWGGSYELDEQKHMDILHTILANRNGNVEPFDLVIDIGANSGYLTEKYTTRHFGKNYIMIEAYEGMKRLFDMRFGDKDWKHRWFSDQVPRKEGARVPDFEFLTLAVASESGGVVDFCTNNMWSEMNQNQPCPVEKMAVDDMIPERLSPAFASVFSEAESAYVKIDVEGMDELTLRGMWRLLNEERGKHDNGEPRHLVNFIQFEYSPILVDEWKQKEGLENYDLKTVTSLMESMGFETFLMGPRYLPLSHGSWDDAYKWFTEDPQNSMGGSKYPVFLDMACPGPECPGEPVRNVLSADIFAVRSTHPSATKIKLALGACRESKDFNIDDEQYVKS